MIGQRIKFARLLRKRTQQWLAEEVGVNQSSVGQWETGRTEPTVENMSRVAQVLDVNFEWLARASGEITSMQYRPKMIKIATSEESIISEDEFKILTLLRNLPRCKRMTIIKFLENWIDGKEKI